MAVKPLVETIKLQTPPAKASSTDTSEQAQMSSQQQQAATETLINRRALRNPCFNFFLLFFDSINALIKKYYEITIIFCYFLNHITHNT